MTNTASSSTPPPGTSPDHPASRDYYQAILPRLQAPDFQRATFAGAIRWRKITVLRMVIRPVALRQGRHLQVTRFDGRKDISTNHRPEEIPQAIADLLAAGFANVHIRTATEEVDLRLTKKGELLVGRKTIAQPLADMQAATAHNRAKALPLPEGQENPVLVAMGILDRHGRVRPTMRDKFTQINEFLKLLEHVLPEIAAAENHGGEAQKEWVILDCGCGSSHLTLATAHFLGAVKHLPVRVVGIDHNPEVIAKSQARAAAVPQLNLQFRVGPIGAMTDIRADIVLALHACDTATDDALVQAMRSEARLILAVPCCHKELHARLRVPALAAIQRHGILQQRLADLVTDTFRSLLLEVMGYRTEVIEFIAPEHTARNLMLRAVRVRAAGATRALEHYREFRQFIGVTPYLETALAGLLPGPI